jgi:hypothetical protein
MSKKQGLYLGKAGHLVVMAEFLLRGWNVAIPEVDVGDDVYVVEDGTGSLKQVQVKTVSEKLHKDGTEYSGRITIRADQLRSPSSSLYYVFIVRRAAEWGPPVVISQMDLQSEFLALGGIPEAAKSLNVTLTFKGAGVRFRRQNWTSRAKDFSQFPVIHH